MMDEILRELESSGWYREPGADKEALESLQRSVRWHLPPDYLAYLRWSSGGEGSVKDAYVAFWPAEEVVALNQDYGIQQWLPDCLAFATDGGSKAYCLDYRTQNPAVVYVPLGDLDYSSAERVADDFRMFLSR